MGCCGCFELFRRVKRIPRSENGSASRGFRKGLSREQLLGYNTDDSEGNIVKRFKHAKFMVPVHCYKSSDAVEDVTSATTQKVVKSKLKISARRNISSSVNEDVNRIFPVKMTHREVHSEDFDGNKMINEYVRVCLIATGSYGKVFLHRNQLDGNLYAIKVLRKSRLCKVRVAPSQTALTDVMREVEIMKILHHPRIVNLIEVIDDPDSDHFYMVLEYVEGGGIFRESGPPGGIGQATAQLYFRDTVEGLVYLHKKNVVHGDIKPENLLVTSEGRIKIGDFSISQMFESGNDLMQRSPGTPVFTAPECCTGSQYHGKIADIWALGVTLYCMVFGCYPFIDDTLQDLYDKILHKELSLPDLSNHRLAHLLERLLCKDPKMRISLEEVARHPWFLEDLGHKPV